MKIGIITDIHSNIQALKTVLNEFDKEKVDKIICCGDIIGIGINPEETVQELIKRQHMLIAVVGNHEKYLLNGLPKNVHDDKRTMSNEEINADVFLYGHTHTYNVNNKKDKWYINTGTLGCPMNSNIARAGILEIKNGKIKFKAVNVKYNVKEIIEEINSLKFPFYKKILEIFY